MKFADKSHNHTFKPACCTAVIMKYAEQKKADQILQVRCAVNIKIIDQSCGLKLMSFHVFLQPEEQVSLTFWPASAAENMKIADQSYGLKRMSIHVLSSLRSSPVTLFSQPEQVKT